MSQAWQITSGKGGAGKTMLAAAMAYSLARRHLQTVIVDMDTGLRNLDILYGLQNKVVFDISDVAEGVCKLRQALILHPTVEALSLLPASQTRTVQELSGGDLRRIVKKLLKTYSYVLLDCPAGIDRGFHHATGAAEHAIVVTTPDDVAIRDAERVLALLREKQVLIPWLVVNRVSPKLVRAGEMYSPQVVANILDTPLLGYIPEDVAVTRALLRHETAVEEAGPAQAAIERITRRFLGEYVPIPPLEKRGRFFARREGTVGL